MKLFYTAAFAVLAWSLPTVAFAQQDPEEAAGWPKDNCHTAVSVGTGVAQTRVCISSTGNITRFEAPAGVEHIAVGHTIEGYKVCRRDGYVSAYDSGGQGFGWSAPTISQPNGPNTLPLQITRTTHSDLRLVQEFTMRSRPYGPADLIITMKVYNTGGTTITGVEILRMFDADVNGDTNDDIAMFTTDTAAVMDLNGRGRSMTLSAGILDKPHKASVSNWQSAMMDFHDTSPYCTGPYQAQPLSNQEMDWVGLLTYQVGDILPGRVKTVEYVYRVQ